jgi:DNA-binding LacI/PurR family transcriptional regulator
MGQPQKGAVAAIRHLYSRGYTIIIFTGRPVQNPNVKQAVAGWLEHFQIPYHDITNVKPDGYGFIIDNRAIHYDTWESVLVRLHHLETKAQDEQYTHEDLDKVDKTI